MKQHSDYITVQTTASLTPVVREVTSALSDSGFGTDWHPQMCHHLTIRMMMDFSPARPPWCAHSLTPQPEPSTRRNGVLLPNQPTFHLPPSSLTASSFLCCAPASPLKSKLLHCPFHFGPAHFQRWDQDHALEHTGSAAPQTRRRQPPKGGSQRLALR